MVNIDFSKDTNKQILNYLYTNDINSVIVEGGAKVLASFIEKNIWDEAYIEIADKKLVDGIQSPEIQGKTIIVR